MVAAERGIAADELAPVWSDEDDPRPSGAHPAHRRSGLVAISPPADLFDGSDAALEQGEISARIPPHDLDAEGAVISAVMVDPSALDKVNEFLKAEHFYSEAHRRIFEACVDLSSKGRPVDVVQVATWLRDRERLAQVGGMPYLTEVLNTAPAVANVAAYARTVHEKWRVRQLVLTCQRVTAQAYAGCGDAGAFLDGVHAEIGALRTVPRAQITLLNGNDLAAPLPPLEYLVAELGLVAGAGAPHLVAGYGFSGKTLALQSLEVALAAGTSTWGLYRVAPRRVLHVDFEQGERLTRRRYQRLALAMGVGLAARGDALALAVMPSGLALTVACAQQWRDLMGGRDLIVIDSLRAATGGQDENDSGIRSGLDMLGSLSEETGCRALVIHHARKVGADDPGGRYAIRGSSAIFDATDSVYLFSAAKGEPVSVEHVKARSHGDLVPDLALVIGDVERDGDPRAGLRVQVHGAELVAQRREEQREAAQRDTRRRDATKLRAVIAAHPGLGTTALRASVGLSGDRMHAALVELGDAVDVREDRQGNAKTMRHYLRGTP